MVLDLHDGGFMADGKGTKWTAIPTIFDHTSPTGWKVGHVEVVNGR